MKVTGLVVGAFAAFASASDFEKIVELVNSKNAGWVAEVPSRFESLDDVKTLCGTWTKGHPKYTPTDLPTWVAPLDAPEPADSFDAREHWPKCTVISKIRDQSACGSCWAFGSTEAFEDSRCAATGEDIEYSTMDTAGCCSGFACGFSQGCNGGQPSAALDWMTSKGVVTGADYYDNATLCKPYTFQPCAHHVPPSSKYPACPTAEYSTTCARKCASGYNGTYADDKTKGSQAHSLNSVSDMQTHISTIGPLAVAFSVYSDFPTYKSGVYKHTSGQFLGGHAVEMIGWGTENGEDYWLIKNSWNEQWGDGGTFKIARGNDECGIEDDVTGITFA